MGPLFMIAWIWKILCRDIDGSQIRRSSSSFTWSMWPPLAPPSNHAVKDTANKNMVIEYLYFSVGAGLTLMYCSKLHAWWSTQSLSATLLSSLIACRWVGLQTLWRFRLKDLSIDEMVGAWCFGCYQVHWGLPVGFRLLRYSVLFTVESLSLLSLLLISWFICSWSRCINKSYMQTKHLCVLIHIWTKGEVSAPLNRFKPSSKIFLLTFSWRSFFCGSFMLFLSCFVMLSCTSVCWCIDVTCWERADLLTLVCDD